MAKWAYVENNVIGGVYDQLPTNWKNVSNLRALESDETTLASLGWLPVAIVNPEYNPQTQRIISRAHHLEDGAVYETRAYEDIAVQGYQPILRTEQEMLEEEWANVRLIRDSLMQDFDWRYDRYFRNDRLGIAQVDNLTLMDIYMQQLADITLQQDPYNIVWPTYTV